MKPRPNGDVFPFKRLKRFPSNCLGCTIISLKDRIDRRYREKETGKMTLALGRRNSDMFVVLTTNRILNTLSVLPLVIRQYLSQRCNLNPKTRKMILKSNVSQFGSILRQPSLNCKELPTHNDKNISLQLQGLYKKCCTKIQVTLERFLQRCKRHYRSHWVRVKWIWNAA